jgi:hypothetical protein
MIALNLQTDPESAVTIHRAGKTSFFAQLRFHHFTEFGQKNSGLKFIQYVGIVPQINPYSLAVSEIEQKLLAFFRRGMCQRSACDCDDGGDLRRQLLCAGLRSRVLKLMNHIIMLAITRMASKKNVRQKRPLRSHSRLFRYERISDQRKNYSLLASGMKT